MRTCQSCDGEANECGGRLTIYLIENIFKKVLARSHATGRRTPWPRGSFLPHRYQRVQEILGHASILSTQVYTKLPIEKRGGRSASGSHITRIVAESAGARMPIKK
jgi:hypothetical protein